MSLRAIEMQVALPRVHDAAKLQEQIQQRGQHQNDLATNSVAKEAEKNRTSVIKEEQKEEVRLKNKERDKQEQQGKKEKEKKEQLVKEVHPYKGNFFDFSG